MNKLFQIRIIGVFLLAFTIAGCIDENIFKVSKDVEIAPSYSIPLGPVSFNINDYLESLDTISIPWPDSLYFNDTLLPNYQSMVIRDENKLYNFSQIAKNLDMVESVMFRLMFSNGYPTPAIIQVYFADDDHNRIDSVFADGPYLLEPAALDDSGLVTAPFQDIQDVYMSPEFMDALDEVCYIIIESTVYTTRPDIPQVKFYSGYAFNVNIAARIQLRFNTKDL
jgi:hypothetical protein